AVLLLLDELVRAAVPDLDRAGAVVTLRDVALEGRVVERMVLDVYGQRALSRFERHALGNGPRGERAVSLEAEVVVETPRVVTLDDEDRLLRLPPLARERLRRRLRIALAPVGVELGHGSSMPHVCVPTPPVTTRCEGPWQARKASPPSGGVDARGRFCRPRAV